MSSQDVERLVQELLQAIVNEKQITKTKPQVSLKKKTVSKGTQLNI